MISKAQQVFYVNTIPTAAIGKEKDIAVHSNGNMYVKKGGRWIVLNISSSEVFGEDKLISGYIELSAPVSTISATSLIVCSSGFPKLRIGNLGSLSLEHSIYIKRPLTKSDT